MEDAHACTHTADLSSPRSFSLSCFISLPCSRFSFSCDSDITRGWQPRASHLPHGSQRFALQAAPCKRTVAFAGLEFPSRLCPRARTQDLKKYKKMKEARKKRGEDVSDSAEDA